MLEQKKTQRADLEGKRLTRFMIGLVASLLLFFAALEMPSGSSADSDDTDQFDEMLQDIDLMPTPERSDMIAAVQPQPKKATQKIQVVDQKTQMEKQNEITQMRTVGEADGAAAGSDAASASDAKPLQTVAVDNNDNPLNFRVVEQLPEFPGGMAAFVKWLTDNLRYPPVAKAQNIQGRVVVSFVINRDGTTSNLKIAQSAHPLLDREAMRVARMMPPWKPGIDKGKPCRTLFAIPVEFHI